MIELRSVRGPTGRLLGELLAGKGILLYSGDTRRQHTDSVQGIVSYGVPCSSSLPTLNANAGRLNKFEELVRLQERGIPTIPFFDGMWEETPSAKEIYFGRKFKHTKGKDIFMWRKQKGTADYFTQYIPHVREFRVWAYRGRHLGTYEKVRKFKRGKNHPDMIWNWRNGYAFEFVHEPPEALKQIGRDAVSALDLDFGAVDVIEDKEGRYYVLELNTAPGVQGPRQGLQNLATKIAKWVEGGFKRRTGDVKQG